MSKPYTIHKPTHKWFAAPGELAIAIGQMRGNMLCINRVCNGRITSKHVTQSGRIAESLTGYGKGVPLTDSAAIQDMRGAWRYMFGLDSDPQPMFCEVHVE